MNRMNELAKNVSFDKEMQLDLARRFSGKLLLRREIELEEKYLLALVRKGDFIMEASMSRTLRGIKCNRCNNRNNKLLATFHCEKCKRVHYYCRNCINMGRITECEPLYRWNGSQFTWPRHENPCTWTGKLTSAQLVASEKIVDAIMSNKEMLVWAVAGSGKTEMLFPGMTEALRQGKRICIATPRSDVVRELLPRLKKAFKAVHIQGLYSGSPDQGKTAQIVIATTHQLLRFTEAFDVIVIDEIDAFPFHHDETLQFAAKRAAKLHAAKIYLTATPRKKERLKMKLKRLPYCFVPLRYHGHLLPIPQFIYDRKLKSLLEKNQLPPTFIHWLSIRQKPSRQVLLFVPTIALAERLIDEINRTISNVYDDHVCAEYVHAEDPDRKEKVERFRNREIYLLITTTILERGVTFPSIDVVVLDAGHIVFDDAALIQIAGRAGRNAKDPTGEIIFIHDGKTDAMERAMYEIKQMNKRAKRMLQRKE